MFKPIGHYRQKLREKGLAGVIVSRYEWYRHQLAHSIWVSFNWLTGKYVELFLHDQIELQGVTLSVANCLISTTDKGPLFFGVYEIGERELSQRHLDPTLPVVEIGGSIGGVACITNRLLSNPNAHVVLECNPLILPTLEHNRAINGCRFAIEPFALAYDRDTIAFNISSEYFMMGRLHSTEGTLVAVKTITLKQILAKYGFDRITLISDSEGSEVELVENESDLLRDRVKFLILELHEKERGKEAIARTLVALGNLGFEILEQHEKKKDVIAMINRNLH